jgi:hypothetical protein
MLRTHLHFDQSQHAAIRQNVADRFASREKEKDHADNSSDQKQQKEQASFHGLKESIGTKAPRQRRARGGRALARRRAGDCDLGM